MPMYMLKYMYYQNLTEISHLLPPHPLSMVWSDISVRLGISACVCAYACTQDSTASLILCMFLYPILSLFLCLLMSCVCVIEEAAIGFGSFIVGENNFNFKGRAVELLKGYYSLSKMDYLYFRDI